MTRVLLVVLCSALAGCPELVTVDDPRTLDESGGSGSGSAEAGACTGREVSCYDRSRAQCNSGCRLVLACRSAMLEQCANLRDADVCDSTSGCDWSLNTCRPYLGGICSTYESQTACNNASYDCEWGDACTGLGTPCRDLRTAATCEANVGCSWVAS